MTDRVVVLRDGRPYQFLVDACAALADQVNEPHALSAAEDELLAVYAEAVIALARLHRGELEGRPEFRAPIAVIDHLIERVHQCRAGEIELRLADVVDRLHAESLSELVGS